MSFDTKVDGVTEETQAILDDFFRIIPLPMAYTSCVRHPMCLRAL